MRKTLLIILNYQREIPPFMINEIRVAKDRFEEIIYLTPFMYNDNSGAIDFSNVVVWQGKKNDEKLEVIKLPFYFFNGRIINEIIKAIRWRRISKKFIKSFLQFIGVSNYLLHKAQNLIKINKGCDIYILSAWMGAEAFAAARLKKKYSYLHTVTLAHSFEVNPLRDKNVDLHFNSFIHGLLDNINFISINVYEKYSDYVIKKYNIDTRNITCIHLGCDKLIETMNVSSEDGILRLVSCSSILLNKQLDRLLSVVSNWDNSTLIWTHIGNGSLFDKISQKANTIMQNNPLVKVNLLGYKSNIEIHHFYAENEVDLFLNISKIEGVPVSLMECMAYGIPAIATDVGGNNEIVNASNGFLLPSDFSDEMLFDILKLYFEMEPMKKQIYRKNAFKQWETNFVGVKNINEFFTNMLNHRQEV